MTRLQHLIKVPVKVAPRKPREQKLVLLPVGKLTNIALALEKAPDISERVRIVWLGSNYPEPGEYNLVNDIPSMNYIIEKGIDPDRITGKGYGETQLINECADGVSCTEAQHAKNRRTEFVIIKM